MSEQWSARDQHRTAVLALLHRGHQLTRGEIADQLRLTRTTVSDVLSGLLESGIITVAQVRPAGGRGRPAEVLAIHPGAVRYIGIDYTHTQATVCLANSAAEVVASGQVGYATETGWEARVRAGVRLIHELATGEVHLGMLAGVGIGLPGPNSASWDGFAAITGSLEPFQLVRARIREVFAEEFHCPVTVDHHIRFAALHEATRDGDLDRSVVYLRISTGIGGAVLGSRVALRGRHQLAGEIGHMIVDESAEARPCRCGRSGCLETVASTDALRRRFSQILGREASLTDLDNALTAGDPAAHDLLRTTAGTVGRVLGIAALVTDPDEIVLSGEGAALLAGYLPQIRDAVAQHCLTGDDVSVRIADPGDEQGARGAIASLRAADLPPGPSIHRPGAPSVR